MSILELVISSAGQSKGLSLNTCTKGSRSKTTCGGRHLITPGMPFLWGISFHFLGEMYIGGQEHFYLETHCTLAVPKGEDGEMELFASTQNPMKTQVFLMNLVPKRQLFLSFRLDEWLFYSCSYFVLQLKNHTGLELSVGFKVHIHPAGVPNLFPGDSEIFLLSTHLCQEE